MEKQVIKLELDSAQTLSATDKVAGAMQGISSVLEELGIRINAITTGSNIIGFLGDAAASSKVLEDELLVMRLALGKLQVAWGQAFAPIAQVVIPAINDAIFAAIRMVRYVGNIISALFGFTDSSDAASDSQESLQSSISKTSKTLKRTLASFDELNRLNDQSSSGSSSSGSTDSTYSFGELSAEQIAFVDWIKSLLEPLQNINLQPLINSIKNLWSAVKPITKELFSGLEWAWFNILVPMAKWAAEQLLPAFLETLTALVQTFGTVINACKPALKWLWENFLKPMAEWTGELILDALEWLRKRLNALSAWMSANETPVGNFLVVALAIAAAVALVSSALDSVGVPMAVVIGLVAALITGFTTVKSIWNTLGQTAKSAWEKVKAVLQTVWGWIKSNVLNPVKTGMKSVVNSIISYLNSGISAMVSAINTIVRSINQLSFTVPSWVPSLGGKRFGFNLKQVKSVSIPYLAKGAVLPANKPFLAMVGDQRHGTNVEAPLSTIQEAVALVMDDVISSNLAGQEAVVGVLRQILEAVLGIRIGDGDIARAVERHQRVRAVINGGL